jgi:hypothetical protein
VTIAELTQWALDLPPEERLVLAEILWESLEQESTGSLHRKKRHAEIALFAREYAGTLVDLDPELEYGAGDHGDHVVLRQPDEFPETTLEDLVGCTDYAGPERTLEDMEADDRPAQLGV